METDAISTVVKRFYQDGVEIYIGSLNSQDILAVHAVDVRDGNPSGYQRQRDPDRCRKVAEFVKATSPRLLPVNIILNLRGAGVFTPLYESGDFGELSIPRREATAWVVDGQHRLGGFDLLPLDLQMELPVIIFKDLDRRLEMFHFKVINEEQKKVNLSLAIELMADLGAASWKVNAHDIVKRLNEDADSPWYQQVNMTGAKGMGRPINQVTFVTALKPLVDSPLSSFAEKPLDDQVGYLKDFWRAVAETWPAPWSTPRGYLLRKAIGVYALCRVAGRIYLLCEQKGDFSAKHVKALVSRLEAFNWDSKDGHFAGYGGTLGTNLATGTLLKALPAVS